MTKPPKTPTGQRIFHNDYGDIEKTEFCPSALRIQKLSHNFPKLKGLQGIDPWDVELLTKHVVHRVPAGTKEALLFVISVWDADLLESFQIDSFSLHRALKSWDKEHHEAFIAWVKTPWWP